MLGTRAAAANSMNMHTESTVWIPKAGSFALRYVIFPDQ
jgi:hypothetical protein